jgi:hypothetical protein
MASSRPSSPQADYAQEIAQLVNELSLEPEREPVASEIGGMPNTLNSHAIESGLDSDPFSVA